METHDEWQITERRYFSEGSMAAIYALTAPPDITEDRPALLAS